MDSTINKNYKPINPQDNKRSWMKFLIIIFVILLISAILYIFLRPKTEEEITTPNRYHDDFKHPGQRTLDLLYVSPKSGELELADTRNSITLAFNVPVDLSTINIITNPKIAFKKTIQPHEVYGEVVVLEPTTPWQNDTVYKIILKPDIKSIDRSYTSEEEIRLEYNIIPTELPNYDRPA
jgi:hypothetical protein